MKAITFKISFFEAFFKCHYTKKFRLSYMMPLPTAIAGILGSILGLERKNIKNYFKDFYFGSKFMNGEGIFEFATLVEISGSKKSENNKSVEKIMIINEPEYEIAVAGDPIKVEEIEKRIEKLELFFMPFGGQNDYFLKDIKFLREYEIEKKRKAYGYFPIDLIKNVEGRFWILPVKYKNEKKDFLFSSNLVELNMDIETVNDIAVYKLEDFSLL